MLIAQVRYILPLKFLDKFFAIAEIKSFGRPVTPTTYKSTIATQFSTFPGSIVSEIM